MTGWLGSFAVTVAVPLLWAIERQSLRWKCQANTGILSASQPWIAGTGALLSLVIKPTSAPCALSCCLLWLSMTTPTHIASTEP
jgi:hypothetical protein